MTQIQHIYIVTRDFTDDCEIYTNLNDLKEDIINYIIDNEGEGTIVNDCYGSVKFGQYEYSAYEILERDGLTGKVAHDMLMLQLDFDNSIERIGNRVEIEPYGQQFVILHAIQIIDNIGVAHVISQPDMLSRLQTVEPNVVIVADDDTIWSMCIKMYPELKL